MACPAGGSLDECRGHAKVRQAGLVLLKGRGDSTGLNVNAGARDGLDLTAPSIGVRSHCMQKLTTVGKKRKPLGSEDSNF